MTRSRPARRKQRGSIDKLPSGALRVRVHGGEDPLSGKRHTLVEIIPAGPKAAAHAEAARTRLLAQVDERRNPRTSATLDQLLDRYLETLDVGSTTHRMYTRYLQLHVRPFIGRTKAGAVEPETLDSLYAELRRCRTHCTDKRGIDHRTPREHECDERCRRHVCKPLSSTTIRHIHFVLRGAYEKGVRWRWVSTNPVLLAVPPSARRPDPRPPSAEEAARIVEAAWEDPEWGALVWLTMTTGARRGELCGLRWSDVELPNGVLTYRRAIAQDGRLRMEKDTKTHQQRRVSLDPETVRVLTQHWERSLEHARRLGIAPGRDAFVFSLVPDGSQHLVPSSVTQRYGRLVNRLGIDTHLHNLRHYSATELIAAGVDVRTVAGRLGHSGGGVTTLRVYAAWLAEADQRASVGLAARVPVRPAAPLSRSERAQRDPRTQRERLAVELREQILSGGIPGGGYLPGMRALATDHGLSISTVKRAFSLLQEWGLVSHVDGERARVLPQPEAAEPADAVPEPPQDAGPVEAESAPGRVPQALKSQQPPAGKAPWAVRLRGPNGLHTAPRLVRASLEDPDTFRPHLVGIARIEVDELPAATADWISGYELEVRRPADEGPPVVVLRWDSDHRS